VRRVILLLLALCVLAPSVEAQKDKKIPKRPQLAAGADTNSWSAYYFHGLTRIEDDPKQAEAAFYWAARLEPTTAEPLYARWAAFWAQDAVRLMRYYLGQRSVVESREVVAIDSLYERALLRDPFLHRSLEKRIWEKAYRDLTDEVYLDGPTADPYDRGWRAYMRGEMGRAATEFGKALQKKPDRTQARIYLARALFFMAEYDSAAAELSRVVEDMRKKEIKKLVYFYQSKAHFEYSIGITHLKAGHLDQAKEAFGRALTEDLSFFMAHARLAEVALATGDTAIALQEHEQAVQLRDDDPYPHFAYARALMQAAKYEEAATHLRRTIELEPYFATPYVNLGVALEMRGQYPDAVASYKAFLARAPRAMEQQITLAKQRIQELDGMPALNTSGSQ
jgi:tetratricopeptide (TPR) repeat protein